MSKTTAVTVTASTGRPRVCSECIWRPPNWQPAGYVGNIPCFRCPACGSVNTVPISIVAPWNPYKDRDVLGAEPAPGRTLIFNVAFARGERILPESKWVVLDGNLEEYAPAIHTKTFKKAIRKAMKGKK